MAEGHVLQTAELAFLAEIGDASFFVAVILAIFCPWRGVRSGKGLIIEYVLVVLGSATALLLRVLLRCWGFRLASVAGELVPPLLAASGLAVLAVLAFWHWQSARGADPELKPVPEMETTPARYGGSFLGSFQAYNPAAYTKASEALEHQSLLAGLLPERQRAKAPASVSMLLAFLLPFCIIFLLETGSRGLELEVARERSNLPACLCGITAAATVAVVAGFALERHVDDQILLLLASLGLVALSVGCLQTAALRYLAAVYAPKLSHGLSS